MKIDEPKNDEQCSVMISEIGEVGRQIEIIEADLSERISELNSRIKEEIEPLAAKKAQLVAGVTDYCKKNKDKLLAGKGKTAEFPGGKVSWKKAKDSVSVVDTEKAVAFIKDKRAFKKFLRVNYSLSKAAILLTEKNRNQALDIPGVSIVSGKEEVTIKPHEAKKEKAA